MPACPTTPPRRRSTRPEPTTPGEHPGPQPFGTRLGAVLRAARILVATVNGRSRVFADPR